MNIIRRTAANVLTLASVAAIGLGLMLQADTLYGFALMDGGGRLTDLGCLLLVAALVAGLAALLPLARWIDDTGRWQGGPTH